MAKEKILQDKDGNEIYPITGSQQVFRNGSAKTVEQSLTELENNGSGIPDAPKDGKTYGRKDGAWTEVTGGSSDAVLYTPQELTEEQQGQARANILALGQQDSTVYDIVHLAWATDAATTRKSIPAGNRKKGLKISYRNANNVYIVEQYQSEDVSDTAWGTDANWKGCRTPLTPLFESIGFEFTDPRTGLKYGKVKFNDNTGYYELNTLNDITESQMIDIYNAGAITGVDNEAKYSGKHIRTNMFWCGFNGSGGSDKGYLINATFRGVTEVIAVNLRFRMQQTSDFLYSNNFGNNTVHTILGVVDFFFMTNGIGKQFGDNLVNATIQSLNVDADFGNCAKLSYYTVSEAVKRSSPRKVITWTMHPNIYALLSGTATDEEYTATGHTKEEWMALVTTAQEKQISFATD